ncbi:hypothetical protein ABGB12_17690 [Actinocorallia sp. B10E7]|uniref:hypothetical protein n=1 Tax=Actinocorallia sp. B10E7 TaxID=3153558 RepID=UPI00325D2A12
MAIEDPLSLLGRLRLGREEFCQRLLTMLILDDVYPRWNSRHRPSAKGVEFLRHLESLCFATVPWRSEPMFVDEFELSRRTESEAGGFPDYALLWPDRVWMIELKTAPTSHRAAQIPTYLELAAHHYPSADIDLTYLTPPMPTSDPSLQPGMRYAHVTWDQVLGVIATIWAGEGTALLQRQAVSLLTAAVRDTDVTWSQWRSQRLGTPPTGPSATPTRPMDKVEPPDPATQAIAVAFATAEDGRQRAFDYAFASLEALEEMRIVLRHTISAAPADDPAHHVMPWIWSTTSGGQALTPAGREVGYELRFSRYESPLY